MDREALIYRDTIDWLFDLQFVGIKMGLDNIRSLASYWGEPQSNFPVIHVAGTNGKGSTASFIAAALRVAGYRTGLYTSPHLVDFSERIRVDGVPIPAGRVVEYTLALRGEIERLNATFFEATTLMALRHFADEWVDVAVVETGLGGRLDATNVVEPVLTVITSISHDHMEFLGDTLEAIAREKAGIMKPGVPCVTVPQKPEVMAVLESQAADLDISLHLAMDQKDTEEPITIASLRRMSCALPSLHRVVDVGLVGRHQVENAAAAVIALQVARERDFPRINNDRIATGLRDVRRLSGLRGRLETLQEDPELVVDVGHNPEGIRVMLETWATVRRMEDTDLVFGVLKSKDLRGIFQVLRAWHPRSITLVQADSPEARPVEDMLRLAAEEGLRVEGRGDITGAVDERLANAGGGSVLLFGSHYVVGAFLRAREKKRGNTPMSLDS